MKCSRCGFETDAAYCAKCGERMPTKPPKAKKPVYKQWWFWVVVGLFVIGIIGSQEPTTGTEPAQEVKSITTPEPTAEPTPEPTPEPTATPIPIEELKSLCKEIDYKSILRDPAAHFGEYVKITVQISQVVDASWSNGYKTGYRCYSDNSGYGVYFDDEYYIEDARPDGSIKLLSDDVITVYGVVYGTIKVERAINGTKDEIAYISMLDCELQGE